MSASSLVLSSGFVVEAIQRDLGLSIDTIAVALGVDRRTVERWRDDRNVPQGKTRERLRELAALRDLLMSLFETPETVQEWLRSPSRYLGGFTPEEILKAGRPDRVRADLEGLAAGIYL
jgi:uncharacterized protein (DUF2384 family)